LLPLILLIYLVGTSKKSIAYAAAIAIVVAIVVSMFNKQHRAKFLTDMYSYCKNYKWQADKLTDLLNKFGMKSNDDVMKMFEIFEQNRDRLSEVGWTNIANVLPKQTEIEKMTREYEKTHEIIYCDWDEECIEIDSLPDEDVWVVSYQYDRSSNAIKFKRPSESFESSEMRAKMEHICRFIWSRETKKSYYNGDTCSRKQYFKYV
jgi:hypothetical protein